MKTFAIATAMLAGLLGTTTNVRAADHHIDEVAFDILNQTAGLVKEIRYGYRHNPEFAHLYEDATEMCKHADYIHRIAHNRAPSAHLAREVSALDETFHHVEEVFAEINRGGAFGVNRYHAAKAARLMALLEDSIHHLQDDLAPGGPVVPAPAVHVQPTIVNPRPVYYRRFNTAPQGGITYRSGNGRFSIRVGH